MYAQEIKLVLVLLQEDNLVYMTFSFLTLVSMTPGIANDFTVFLKGSKLEDHRILGVTGKFGFFMTISDENYKDPDYLASKRNLTLFLVSSWNSLISLSESDIFHEAV